MTNTPNKPTLKAERLASGGSGMKCRCESPQIYLHRLDNEIRCSMCGLAPRSELGIDREPISRVRYRASYNRLIEKAAEAEREFALSRITDYQMGRLVKINRAQAYRDDGHSFAQIANWMNVTESTVKYWLNPKYRESKKQSSLKWAKENPEKRKACQDATNEKRRAQQRAAARDWTRRNPNRKRLQNMRAPKRATVISIDTRRTRQVIDEQSERKAA